MQFAVVQFGDGTCHIVTNKDIKNRKNAEASVLWRKNRTYYAATILKEGNNKKQLLHYKEKYESGKLL